MPKVTIRFKGRPEVYGPFEAQSGQSVLDVALANGVDMQHACGGFAACTTCKVCVCKGTMSEVDPNVEGAFGLTAPERLGCQAKVLDEDVEVEIPEF